MYLIVPFCDFFDNYIFLTKTTNFGIVKNIMNIENHVSFMEGRPIQCHELCEMVFDHMF